MSSVCSGCASARHPDEIAAALAGLTPEALSFFRHDWQSWAREEQLAPPLTAAGEAWRTWLVLGGRGAGKTRAGAEWVRAQALGIHPLAAMPVGRIALVGATFEEARSVMIEGVSGLLAVHPEHERPAYEVSKHQVRWPNGTVAQVFSAEHPDGLRGPQFEAAWCDEIAKWRQADAVWDMLQFGLRLGVGPRQVVTTTPRPVPILNRLMADAGTVVTRMPTADNAAHLAPTFLDEIRRRYAGTVLGAQELDGILIEDVVGALWRRDWIEDARVDSAPPLERVVVAVDPPVTSGASADACGIVVAGLGPDGRGYVVDDRTLAGREPLQWAQAAIAAYRDHAADRIVAEVNQGGDLVAAVLRQVAPNVPIRLVRATRGKWVRAEPVAALYAQGRVVHVGQHAALEAQMLAFRADGRARGVSPDRVDALVWALTELILDAPPRPGIRVV